MEIIVPIIIFAILWIIGKVTGEDDGQPARPAGKTSEDIDERTRRIQEEIRRRIAERQGGGQPQQRPATPQATPPPMQERKHTPLATEQRQEHYEQQRRENAAEDKREREQRQREHHERVERASHGNGLDVVDRYKRQIEEQKRKAREAAKKAEGIRNQQAVKRASSASKKWGGKEIEVSALRRDIYDTLHDPLAARKAFLYYEIMGTPVGLRRDGHQRPHWEI